MKFTSKTEKVNVFEGEKAKKTILVTGLTRGIQTVDPGRTKRDKGGFMHSLSTMCTFEVTGVDNLTMI